ncbi:hypothetical protein AVEN_130542-1 [Araneus ventricosus]|uniref:Uncharacterized protein n=1 Tax=Araneus ventricosus TaxID=182803 RepID=A0A4Y2J5H8_ARAVE|nr:hypothetical protein AVEN_130542-1 [Araneus ventricosus]
MLSDGVILLHGNTHTARKTQELLQKFKCEIWSHPPHTPHIWHPIWVPNTYLEKSSLQTERCPMSPCLTPLQRSYQFSSNSDVKTAAEK